MPSSFDVRAMRSVNRELLATLRSWFTDLRTRLAQLRSTPRGKVALVGAGVLLVAVILLNIMAPDATAQLISTVAIWVPLTLLPFIGLPALGLLLIRARSTRRDIANGQWRTAPPSWRTTRLAQWAANSSLLEKHPFRAIALMLLPYLAVGVWALLCVASTVAIPAAVLTVVLVRALSRQMWAAAELHGDPQYLDPAFPEAFGSRTTKLPTIRGLLAWTVRRGDKRLRWLAAVTFLVPFAAVYTGRRWIVDTVKAVYAEQVDEFLDAQRAAQEAAWEEQWAATGTLPPQLPPALAAPRVERDPWEVLGLEPGSSVDDVKKAYRRLSRLYHPDISPLPDATELMAELNAARDALLAEAPAYA